MYDRLGQEAAVSLGNQKGCAASYLFANTVAVPSEGGDDMKMQGDRC